MNSQKKLEKVLLNVAFWGSLSACAPMARDMSNVAGDEGAAGCVKISDSADKCISQAKLRFADDHQIAYLAFKIKFTDLEHPLPNTSFSLSFEFPGLSEQNFHKLMERYGGQDYVKWLPNRTQPYELVDFLPPKIQALIHRTLKQDYLPFPPNELPPEDFWVRKAGPRQDYETGMACWDAA